MASIIMASLLACYLTFESVIDLPSRLKPYAINGDYTRQVVLILFLLLYILRLFITVFVFLKRKMVWSEILLVSSLMSFVLSGYLQSSSWPDFRPK